MHQEKYGKYQVINRISSMFKHLILSIVFGSFVGVLVTQSIDVTYTPIFGAVIVLLAVLLILQLLHITIKILSLKEKIAK